jgi:hypothetical protein
MFFKCLTPALNTRLSHATHLFGRNYSAELRVTELRSSVEGVNIKINNTTIKSVDAYKLSSKDLKPDGKFYIPRGTFFIAHHSVQPSGTADLMLCSPMVHSHSY